MKFDLEDIGFLEKKTDSLKKILEKEFDLKVVSKKWPISYSYGNYMFVFSLMGSFTMLWNNEKSQKTIPIYHLSLLKNHKKEIIWCDIDGIKIDEKNIAPKIKDVLKEIKSQKGFQ